MGDLYHQPYHGHLSSPFHEHPQAHHPISGRDLQTLAGWDQAYQERSLTGL